MSGVPPLLVNSIPTTTTTTTTINPDTAPSLAPVIVNASQKSTPTTLGLASLFKMRVSNHCIPDYIFPTYHLAFMLVELNTLTDQTRLKACIERIVVLGNTFERSFVIVVLNNSWFSLQVLSRIQMKVTSSQLLIVPCFSSDEVVRTITSLLNSSKHRQQKCSLDAEGKRRTVIEVLSKNIPGLTKQDALKLWENVGSIQQISSESVENIIAKTGLSIQLAESIWNFFQADNLIL